MIGKQTPQSMIDVLADVRNERMNQIARYGPQNDLEDGSGPSTRWLGPYTGDSAWDAEEILRQDYEDYEEETGVVTWTHLLREEVAEALQESDLTRLRAELIQVAAVAVSWAESLDYRAEERAR